MKKMLMLVVASVMIMAFVPSAYSAQTAQLELAVTFAHDPDLERVLELKNEVGRLQEHAMDVFENAKTSHDPEVIEGAIDELVRIKDVVLNDIKSELEDILSRRPDLASHINPILTQIGLDQSAIQGYIDTLEAMLPNISVTLEGPNPWMIEGVGLGQIRSNNNAHRVINDGNVPIRVDIGYGILPDVLPLPGVRPGEDRYATWVNHEPFDPVSRKIVIADLDAGGSQNFLLEYGSPTSLTDPVPGMSTSYEIRAFRETAPIG